MITLVTVAGTVARWWEGYPADAGRYLTEWQQVWKQLTGQQPKFYWQGAEYPSATFPMRPSILAGWEEVVNLLLNKHTSGPFVLDGYSQGAIVVCMVWREEILNPAGRLHHRLNDCRGVITYGNPMRAPGIAYGNTKLWGKPAPKKLDGHTTGGIAGPTNLKPEECVFPEGHPLEGKPAVYDFALDGDLYAAAPVGDEPWDKETDVGHNQTLIYEMVMDFNGGDIFAFAKQAAKIVGKPLSQILPLVQAMWNAVKFFGAGTGAPHWQYDAGPAIAWLDSQAA